MNKLGTLYGISVGTGDPELITVKGLRILQQSPVIAFPKGVNNRLGFAQNVITNWLKSQQELLPLVFPYVLDEDELKQAWKQSAEIVFRYLKEGQDVAFACEGDVNFYGTFTYLAQTLKEHHPKVKIETIPGVSSPMATASALGIPLTLQGQSLVILPALYGVKDLEKALEWADVVILMKVASVYSQVWKVLAEKGLFHKAIIIEKATLPEQKIYSDLQNYPDLQLSYFSILIISENLYKIEQKVV